MAGQGYSDEGSIKSSGLEGASDRDGGRVSSGGSNQAGKDMTCGGGRLGCKAMGYFGGQTVTSHLVMVV